MSHGQLPFVSIVFPNFNGGTFVTSVIEALLKQQYPPDCYEIIMVDNASTDGSLQHIRGAYPELMVEGRLRVLEFSENRGAPAAYNYGIAKMSPRACYLLKTDNDVVLEPDCLRHLVQCAEADPSVGIVGGKVKYFWDRRRIHLVGSRISPWFGACLGIGKSVLDRGQYNLAMGVQAVNGCLMLVRRSVIDQVGPMDEQYFLYFDDIDWAIRATRAGFRHRYVPLAVAYHNTASPRQRFRSTRWGYFNAYNTCYLAKRHFTRLGQLICWGILSLKILFQLPKVVIHNRRRSQIVLRALWLGYRRGTRLLFTPEGGDESDPVPPEIIDG